jgi:hypothetical protein
VSDALIKGDIVCMLGHPQHWGGAFVMAIHTAARRCREVSEAHKCDAAITEGAVSRRTFSGTTFPFFRAAHRWGVGWGEAGVVECD